MLVKLQACVLHCICRQLLWHLGDSIFCVKELLAQEQGLNLLKSGSICITKLKLQLRLMWFLHCFIFCNCMVVWCCNFLYVAVQLLLYGLWARGKTKEENRSSKLFWIDFSLLTQSTFAYFCRICPCGHVRFVKSWLTRIMHLWLKWPWLRSIHWNSCDSLDL